MTKGQTASRILEKAARGKGILPEEANVLMDADRTDLEALIRVADALTRRAFGRRVDQCAIYPAKVGRCFGDCAFCAQSARHPCDVAPVRVSALRESEVVSNAITLWESGVRRYSLVTSGESLTDEEFDRILHLFQRLKQETEIGLCASVGSLTPDRAERLKQAGVSRYHHNIETARSFFPHICSTHGYEEKIRTLHIARQAGMERCAGGIIAMGETPEQRVEMAFALKELEIDCIPINILHPIPGTRLEHQPPLSADEILRTIAVFRLILPDSTLKFAGGRERALGEDEYRGYAAGINSTLIGNYLTTTGKPHALELRNLEAAGLMPTR